MDDTELMALVAPLIAAVVAAVLQKLRAWDTNKHGDAFVDMLNDAGQVFDQVAEILPQIRPAVVQYNEVVAEAERIWESSGFTADDMRYIQFKAEWYKGVIEDGLETVRKLRE